MQHKHMSNSEAAIVLRLVDTVLASGHSISVWEGEDWAIRVSRDKAAIWEALASTDSDNLVIRAADKRRIGSVLLIYGNGVDIISDMTDTPEIDALVAPANALAETLTED